MGQSHCAASAASRWKSGRVEKVWACVQPEYQLAEVGKWKEQSPVSAAPAAATIWAAKKLSWTETWLSGWFA